MRQENVSDSVLIAKAKEGDMEAFESLVGWKSISKNAGNARKSWPFSKSWRSSARMLLLFPMKKDTGNHFPPGSKTK